MFRMMSVATPKQLIFNIYLHFKCYDQGVF